MRNNCTKQSNFLYNRIIFGYCSTTRILYNQHDTNLSHLHSYGANMRCYYKNYVDVVQLNCGGECSKGTKQQNIRLLGRYQGNNFVRERKLQSKFLIILQSRPKSQIKLLQKKNMRLNVMKKKRKLNTNHGKLSFFSKNIFNKL